MYLILKDIFGTGYKLVKKWHKFNIAQYINKNN